MEFIVDIGLQRLVRGISDSSAATTETFYRGDQHSVKLALLENGVPIDPATATVKLGLGLGLDTLPPEGKFFLGFASAETTVFSYAGSGFPTAAAVGVALNALATITAAGGVTVTSKKPGIYRVDFNIPGARAEFEASGSFLPSGVILVNRLRLGDATYPEVQQIQLSAGPFALATGFVQTNPVATFTQGVAGVYTLQLPATTLDAVISWGGSILARNGASSGQMQSALASAGISAQATALDGRTWIIMGTAVPTPVITLRAAPVLTAALALDSPALVAALGSQTSLAARLEIEVTRPGTRITAVQTAISISRTVLEDPTIPAGSTAGVYMLRAVYDSDADGIIDEANGVRGPGGVISGATIAAGLAAVGTLDRRVDALESAPGYDPTALENQVANHETRIDSLEAGGGSSYDPTAIEAELANHETRIDSLEAGGGGSSFDPAPIEARVNALETTEAGHENRIDALEAAPAPAPAPVVFGPSANGLVPAPGTGSGRYLREDGTWHTPAGGGGSAGTVYTPPLIADFSGWLNQEWRTATNALGKLVISGDGAFSGSLGGLVKPLSTLANFEYRARIRVNMQRNEGNTCGLFLRDSVAGEIFTFPHFYSNGYGPKSLLLACAYPSVSGASRVFKSTIGVWAWDAVQPSNFQNPPTPSAPQPMVPPAPYYPEYITFRLKKTSAEPGIFWDVSGDDGETWLRPGGMDAIALAPPFRFFDQIGLYTQIQPGSSSAYGPATLDCNHWSQTASA